MMLSLQLLLEPLSSYGFMREGLLAAVVVGLVSAALSCLLVVRHQALLGDAISHAVLLGVTIGFVTVGVEGILPGALLIAMLTGVAITYLERNTPIQLDAAMGICFTTAFALGLAIISIVQPRGIDLFHVLFGNIIGLHRADLWLIVTTGMTILVVVMALFRWLHVWSFDPELSGTLGVPVRLVEYLFTALLSAAVVVSMNAVGLLLVVAMLIIPGATALLLATRLQTMMLVASGVGVFSAVAGLYGSFYINVASGPAIVLTTAGCFGLALVLAPNHGLLATRWNRRRYRQSITGEDLLAWLSQQEQGHAPANPRLVAEALNLPLSSVRLAVRHLVRRGWLTLDGQTVALTDRGRTQAAHADRQDAASLARSASETPPGTARSAASRPHEAVWPATSGALTALTATSVGRSATVMLIDTEHDDMVLEAARLGLLPGAVVRVLANTHGHQLIDVSGSMTVAVPESVANCVVVGDDGCPDEVTLSRNQGG